MTSTLSMLAQSAYEPWVNGKTEGEPWANGKTEGDEFGFEFRGLPKEKKGGPFRGRPWRGRPWR
jgi:hypothetical protein